MKKKRSKKPIKASAKVKPDTCSIYVAGGNTLFLHPTLKPNKKPGITVWYRCMGIEQFIRRVEVRRNIMGITFDGSNIGFLTEDR